MHSDPQKPERRVGHSREWHAAALWSGLYDTLGYEPLQRVTDRVSYEPLQRVAARVAYEPLQKVTA